MPPRQRKSEDAASAAGSAAKQGTTKVAASTKKRGAKPRPESIDIYVRMNEDPNKDYCFNVPTNEPVSWLMKIFDTIPILLSPSYLYDANPEGFAISVHPGYMTAEGGILFSDKAHHERWLKKVPSTALMGDVFTEGQLIVPIWRHNKSREFRVLVTLLVWLYLDLPEFISPTPGTAPSKILFWIADQFFEAPREPEGPSIFANKWWQVAFFCFHILKVSFIYLILWNGLWHPVTLNPLKKSHVRQSKRTMPSADALNSIGWTGTRRCGLLEWSERYLQVKTKRAGGILEAHRQGLLIKPIGLHLRDDEGWNVLKNKTLDQVEVQDDLLDADGKFVVSNEYFTELSKPLARFIKNPETSEKEAIAMLKEFRETGGVDGTDFMREFFSDLVEYDEREYGGKHVDQVGKN